MITNRILNKSFEYLSNKLARWTFLHILGNSNINEFKSTFIYNESVNSNLIANKVSSYIIYTRTVKNATHDNKISRYLIVSPQSNQFGTRRKPGGSRIIGHIDLKCRIFVR